MLHNTAHDCYTSALRPSQELRKPLKPANRPDAPCVKLDKPLDASPEGNAVGT